MTPPNRTGPRTAEIQNHLVRTRSTNSRRMTAQTLCTGANSLGGRGWNGGCRRRLRTHEVDENLVKGRARQLKPRQTRARLDQSAQDLLGVGAARQLKLGLLAEILNLCHEPAVCENPLRSALAAVERNDQVLAPMRAFHFGQCAVDELLATRDNAQPIAQLFGVLHDVRGEEHGLATPAVID